MVNSICLSFEKIRTDLQVTLQLLLAGQWVGGCFVWIVEGGSGGEEILEVIVQINTCEQIPDSDIGLRREHCSFIGCQHVVEDPLIVIEVHLEFMSICLLIAVVPLLLSHEGAFVVQMGVQD